MEHLRSQILEFGDAVQHRDLRKIIASCISIEQTCSRLLEEYSTNDKVTRYLQTIRYMATRTKGVAKGGGIVLPLDSAFNFGFAGQTFNRFVEHLTLIAKELNIQIKKIRRRFKEIES